MRKYLSYLVVCSILVLLTGLGFLVQRYSAQAASYTITYQDADGRVIYTTTANAGDVIDLPDFPDGAIAWVDMSDSTIANVSTSARGRAYINYNLASPQPSPQPFTMTMPARNVVLTAFYGNYQNGNEPRLLQFHLELKYFDINSGCDIAFVQQYSNISAPAGFVINLPGPNFFDPMSMTTSGANCSSIGTFSDLSIYKWVADESYTGQTVPPSDILYDPNQLVYVDPNNYNMIYDVMVDPNLDWNGGGEIQPPDIGLPPASTSVSTVTFRIDDTVWTDQTATTPSGQNATTIGGGFNYNFAGSFASGNTASGRVMAPNSYADSAVWNGITWGQWFGVNSVTGSGIFPVGLDVPGYTWWWTDQDGNTIVPNGIAANFGIVSDQTYTLHYAVASPPPTPVVIRFNRASYVFDSTEHTASGFVVVSGGSTPNIPSNTSTTVDLGNGNWLLLQSRVAGADVARGTFVGTYPLSASARDILVYNGDPMSGGTLIPNANYTFTVRPGGLTITPTFTEIYPPSSCPNGATNFPVCDDHIGGGGGGNGGGGGSGGGGGGNVDGGQECVAQRPGDPPPHIYRATANGRGSITIHFETGGEPFNRFLLEYGIVGRGFEYGAMIDNPRQGSFTINDLVVGQAYQFRITPMNDCAAGAPSNTFPVSVGLPGVPGLPNTGGP
jgi:hypothetical protein